MKITPFTADHSYRLAGGVTIGSSPAAGIASQIVEILANQSGADVAAGDVVVIDTTTYDEAFHTTTTPNVTSAVGVALEDILSADTGRVVVGGYAPLVNVHGSNTTRGHYLSTSSNAGSAAEVTSRAAGTWGQLLTGGTTPSAHIFMSDLGAGGGGGTLLGTVGWYDAKVDGGLAGNGSTDDTASLQTLITTATASGTRSATIYFPSGVYLIGGALQDTGARNAQILFPVRSDSASTITLHLLGANRPPMGMAGPLPGPTDGTTVFKSTLTGASGTAAVFSAGQYPNYNNVNVIIENLLCLYPADPSMTFWNFDVVRNPTVRNVIGATPAWSGYPTQPTHSNAYFVKLSHYGVGDWSKVDGLIVNGYYTALLQTDLTITRGLIGGFCIVGIELPFAQHSSVVEFMEWIGCPTPIKVTGDHYCDVRQASFEHWNSVIGAPAWIATTNDVDDPGNHLFGHIRWYLYDPLTGFATTGFTINGGSHIAYEQFGALPASTPSGSAGGDLGSTYPSPTVTSLAHATPGGDLAGSAMSAPTVAKLQGRALASTAPTDGQAIVWDAAGSTWKPGDVSTGTLIWRPVTVFDPTTGNYLPLVDGSGNAIMAEA